MIKEMIEFNKKFVEDKKYEQYKTSKYPDKKIAILSCMDTRLTELLPAALGIKNGDVKIIKNAGGVVTHPFGSVVRSLLVAIFELGVEEIMVIGHTDCGVQHINSDMMIEHMINRGVLKDNIDIMKYCGIDFENWLAGFDWLIKDGNMAKVLEGTFDDRSMAARSIQEQKTPFPAPKSIYREL